MGFKSWLEDEEKIFNEIKIGNWPLFYMDIAIGGCPEGRIVFELYPKLAPNTVKNFKTFCLGGLYRNAKFNQIIKGCGIITDNNGFRKAKNGYDLYHVGENSNLRHDQIGLLSTTMDANGSKFLITLSSCPQYDKSNIVFGKVVKGLCLLKEIENVITDDNNSPLKSIAISSCGMIFQNEFNDLFRSQYPDWPEDLIDYKDKDFPWWMGAVGYFQILASLAFKMKDYEIAARNYKKALRYLEFYLVEMTDRTTYRPFILKEFKSEFSKQIEDCLKCLENEKRRLRQFELQLNNEDKQESKEIMVVN
ncbi:hypothetical protein DITRI_Ditri10aG0075000 [Diplodiscus trichospermus]